MWATMRAHFREAGWAVKAPFHYVAYYFDDNHETCNTVIDANGSHGTHLPATPQLSGGGYQPHMRGSHTSNTPIEHLAYHLAWNIYETYSEDDKPIDVVAHSMGGLIIRYALAATALKHPDFPPYLLVEDVVTLGTPHGGSRGPGAGLQGSQMAMGSQFLKTLERPDVGYEPDGRGGTNWTTIGSDDDTAVAADRAVGTERDRDPTSKYIGSSNKIWYTTANNIEHSDYYKDESDKQTAVAYQAFAGSPFLAPQPVKTYWPVRRAFHALVYGNR